MPGARHALTVVHPRSPVLRIRYRDGVLVDPYGFPDWLLYARAIVEMPAVPPGLGRDEIRVLDVLAANAVMAGRGDDPLWSGATGTPDSWCWAHLGRSRRLALVPIELHGADRHGGGMRTTVPTAAHRGLRAEPGQVAIGAGDAVPDDLLDDLERLIGQPLPAGYRAYLGRTNGAGPVEPAVVPDAGFVVDQPLFGIARDDPHQDLAFARDFLTDRFAPGLLPIGYVQGGLLALELTGPAAGAVWYWDDDDPRDDDAYGPAEIRATLVRRCARTFDEFLAALIRPPAALVTQAAAWASTAQARVVPDELTGASLPAAMRPPGAPSAPRHR